MKIKIDFSLGRRFGVVEQAIFRLVMAGITSTWQISYLLGVFSDEVVANALRRLVNQQILRVDLEAQILSLSDALMSIIIICLNTSYDLDIPTTLAEKMSDGYLPINDVKTKEVIIAQLLPNINLGFLAKSLDLSICKWSDRNE